MSDYKTCILPVVLVQWCRRWLSLCILLSNARWSSSLTSIPIHLRHERYQTRISSCLHSSPQSMASNGFTSLIQEYCQLVEQSIHSQHFLSLHLEGPSKKAATKEELRGSITHIRGRLVAAAAVQVPSKARTSRRKSSSSSYLQMTFKYHSATDVAKNWKEQYGVQLQELLEATQDTSNYKSEWGVWHASGTKLGLRSCTLTTTIGITELDLRKMKIRTKSATSTTTTTSSLASISSQSKTLAPQPMVANHDRTKQVPVASDAPFWNAIGLDKMTSKRRQCQKFVEIVASLISQVAASSSTTVSSSSPSPSFATTQRRISTVDMGCGRGYLTFALHHYLLQQQQQQGSYANVTTRGIDMRPKLVNEMNSIVTSLTAMQGLSFETGTIDSFLAASKTATVHRIDDNDNTPDEDTNHDKMDTINILIALHACDTATDDALWSGIQSQAQIIVVAPCCHKQIRPQLDAMVASSSSSSLSSSSLHHPFLPVLKHGIYRERMAETVTDSMRAILLELAHYHVKVFEFIGGEHTSKNVMITAVKRARRRGVKELEDLRRTLRELALVNGIREHKLASLMEEDMGEQIQPTRLSSKAMPPM